MKLKNKLGAITAVVVTFAAVTWMVIGGNGITTSPSKNSSQLSAISPSSLQPNNDQDQNGFPVQAKRFEAKPVELHISLSGKTLANESLVLVNNYAGRVTDLKGERGQFIDKGDSILQIDNRALTMELSEANLLVKQRQLELDGIKLLNRDNFSSRVNQAQAETALAAAQSIQNALRINLENANLTAPFSGFLNSLDVTKGQVLPAGVEVGTLVSLNPLKIQVDIPQNRIHQITLGTQATIRFTNNDETDGTVSFISTTANDVNRTITVEIQVDNSNNLLRSGLTASVDFILDQQLAHALSPALLTLDDTGQSAVKTINSKNLVELSPVEVIRSTRNIAWVGGLPKNVNIITVGQGFVSIGDKVNPHYTH